MSKLTRYTQLLFGSSASANQIAEYGSLAANAPARYSGATITPDIVQGLPNYLEGWFAAVLLDNAPCTEDLNAIDWLYSYQLAYLMQAGIAEYDSATTYYIGSLVNSAGKIFVSLTDGNVGNALTSATNWVSYGGGSRTVAANTGLVATDNIVRSNSTSGALTQTLPTIASSFGVKITIKDVGSGGFTTSVKGNGSETIDGNNTYSTALSRYDSITVFNNGTTWDVL